MAVEGFQNKEGQKERWPAMEKKITEIEPSSDKRVRLTGTVVGRDVANGMISLDDGTGKINAFFDDLKVIEKLDGYKEGDPVLVVGRVAPTPEGFDLNGEVIRSVKGMDFELLEKVRKKLKEV